LRKLAQCVIIEEGELLLVKQKTKRGAVVWNFPGGGVEEGETFEEAAIREVFVETGFVIEIVSLLRETEHKKTFIGHIIGGSFEKNIDADILDLEWIHLSHKEKFDEKVKEILNLLN